MKHVVATAKRARPLERQHVERFLDHAQACLVATRIEADRADRLVGDVEAGGAVDDLIAHGCQGRRQGPRFGLGRTQQVVRQPLRCLGTNAGQARK